MVATLVLFQTRALALTNKLFTSSGGTNFAPSTLATARQMSRVKDGNDREDMLAVRRISSRAGQYRWRHFYCTTRVQFERKLIRQIIPEGRTVRRRKLG